MHHERQLDVQAGGNVQERAAVAVERAGPGAERGVARHAASVGKPAAYEVGMIAHRGGPTVEDEALVRRVDWHGAVLGWRVRRIEQFGGVHTRKVLQRKAAPLLFLPGRPLGLLEPLERGETIFEQPAGLTTPNTEPLDRWAVERQ